MEASIKPTWLAIALLTVATAMVGQNDMHQPDVKMYKQQPPRMIGTSGVWRNTTLDSLTNLWISEGGKLLFTEDYEIEQTHEVCATVSGYFMKNANIGRFDVRFKGIRTPNSIEFTTQSAAAKLVQNACLASTTPVK